MKIGKSLYNKYDMADITMNLPNQTKYKIPYVVHMKLQMNLIDAIYSHLFVTIFRNL